VLTFFQKTTILSQTLSFKLERPFMKNIQMLAGCVLILAMAGVARAETYTRPAAITVVGVTGEARYSIDGTIWRPLVVGKILHQGAVLETASGSSVDLVLSGTPVPVPESSSAPSSLSMVTMPPDPNVRGYAAYKPMSEQNVVHMQGNSMLAIDQLSVINTGADTVGNTELDLRAGGVFLNVKKLSASSQFIVKLPNGVAGIRGSLTYIDDGQVAVFEGEVTVVTMVNGQLVKKTVQGGFHYDLATGEISDISGPLKRLLRAFGIRSRTFIDKNVVITQNQAVIDLSPKEGRQPLISGGGGGGGEGGGGGGGGEGGG
jgi:hypothetical protein